MLLIPAVALTVVGLAIWVAGIQMGYQGIATVGAVLVVGVGISVMTGDLERRAGSVEEQVSSDKTVISVQTTEVDFISSFNAGLIWSLLGGVLVLQALNSNTS